MIVDMMVVVILVVCIMATYIGRQYEQARLAKDFIGLLTAQYISGLINDETYHDRKSKIVGNISGVQRWLLYNVLR